jgi:hypothetical protein
MSYNEDLLSLIDRLDTLIEFNELSKEKVYNKLELDEHSGITKLTKAIKRLEEAIRNKK